MNLINLAFKNFENSAKEITGKVVENVNGSEIVKDIGEGIVNALPDKILNKISLFLDIGKIFLIVLIAYFVFLIIKQIWRLKDSYRIGVIAKNTEDIVKKLGIIKEQNDEIIELLDKKKIKK